MVYEHIVSHASPTIMYSTSVPITLFDLDIDLICICYMFMYSSQCILLAGQK
jgi:hypothetical protein